MDDYRAATRALVTLREEQGRTNTFIPKLERTEQRNILIQQYRSISQTRGTEATTGSDIKNNDTWIQVATQRDKWKEKDGEFVAAGKKKKLAFNE